MSDILSLIINASWLVQIVMLILVIMSVYSWTIVLSKKTIFMQSNKEISYFETKLNSNGNNDLDVFYSSLPQLKHNRTTSENIFATGYQELHHNNDIHSSIEIKQLASERAYRAMSTIANKNIDNLNKDLSILAMVANSSPYIGLFGTVWGIMQAFIGLASVKQATIAIVAPGIAEALIATAFGLFAAIPASIFYNRMVTELDLISQKHTHLIEELFIKFQR